METLNDPEIVDEPQFKSGAEGLGGVALNLEACGVPTTDDGFRQPFGLPLMLEVRLDPNTPPPAGAYRAPTATTTHLDGTVTTDWNDD